MSVKEEVGEYWLGHLINAGVDTEVQACGLSWEGHPKVSRKGGTSYFMRNLLNSVLLY